MFEIKREKYRFIDLINNSIKKIVLLIVWVVIYFSVKVCCLFFLFSIIEIIVKDYYNLYFYIIVEKYTIKIKF